MLNRSFSAIQMRLGGETTTLTSTLTDFEPLRRYQNKNAITKDLAFSSSQCVAKFLKRPLSINISCGRNVYKVVSTRVLKIIKQMVELFDHRLAIWISLAIILGIYVKTLRVAGIPYVRLNRWPNLTVIERLPVDAMEKGMSFDLLGTTTNVSQAF